MSVLPLIAAKHENSLRLWQRLDLRGLQYPHPFLDKCPKIPLVVGLQTTHQWRHASNDSPQTHAGMPPRKQGINPPNGG